MKKITYFILMIFAFTFLLGNEKAVSLGFNLQYQSYASFSEQRINTRMIAGYPALKAEMFIPGIVLKTEKHEVHAAFSIPARLRSDNGTGLNLLLDDRQSHYTRAFADYAYYFPLFTRKALRAFHAVHAGLLYEDRYVHYLSDTKEHCRDLNIFIGPRLQANLDLKGGLQLRFRFDARFYLPYLNIGSLVTYNETGTPVYSSRYHAFYYNSIIDLGIQKKLPGGMNILVGAKKNDLVGFANSSAVFYTDDLIHFKLDHTWQFYFEILFDHARN